MMKKVDAEQRLIKFLGDARKYRTKWLGDKHRHTYHFIIPDGHGLPTDPNGMFFADGKYHLMYLYLLPDKSSYHWGHLSSLDLLHWREHPDALTDNNGDKGCWSGGAFVDEDGTAYLSYWKFPSADSNGDNGGIAIAYAKPPYEKWERMETLAVESTKEKWGIAEIEVDGEIKYVGCADPSNIWKANGWYYMQSGNLPLLQKYGEEFEEYRGNYTDLYKSEDLKHWQYAGRFYTNPRKDETYPDHTEDDMCPIFLPLFDKRAYGKPTGKYLQLFISHNKGAQYYIGTLEGERFIPDAHGRLTWNDNHLFAPEALIDDKNRQIAWFWLKERDTFPLTESQIEVLSFPRVFWLENDGLKMSPIEELDNICYNQQIFTVGQLNGMKKLSVKNGELFRIKATVKPNNSGKVGFRLRASNDETEYTDIYVDATRNKLVFDAENSSTERPMSGDEAPFKLCNNENIQFDIFVDKTIVEVYVNNRQAICRRVYPMKEDSLNVYVFADDADFEWVVAWEVFPTNPY